MSFYQEARSLKNLKGVHPDLAAVVYKAVKGMDEQVLVVEGMRTIAQQRKYVNAGKSKTMNSRHLTGHAVDLVIVEGGKSQWSKPHSTRLADAMQVAADELSVEIDRGYDWGWDAPHFQLDWKAYPKQDTDWKSKSVAEKVAKPVKKAPVTVVGGGTGLILANWWSDIVNAVSSSAGWLQGVAVELATLTPVKTMFVQAGANVQALTIGGIVFAICLVTKKAMEDD